MKNYKNCQSCGMPLKRDLEKGGTNLDGTKNVMYCSFCYQQGKFTQNDFNVKEMQKFCKQKLKEMGCPGFVAGLFSRSLSRLERWKIVEKV